MQPSTYHTALIAIFALIGGSAAAPNSLNPACHPGGNFDLSKWALETPIDNGSKQPLVINAAQLSAAGGDACKDGWQDKGSDHSWFFTVRLPYSSTIPFLGTHHSPSQPGNDRWLHGDESARILCLAPMHQMGRVQPLPNRVSRSLSVVLVSHRSQKPSARQARGYQRQQHLHRTGLPSWHRREQAVC